MCRNVVALCVVAVICTGLSSCQTASKPATQASSAPDGQPQWLTSMTEAAAKANASSRLILADFTGSDWCIYCKKLKAEVFDTPEFREWAGKNVVLLELDFPRTKKLDARLKAQNAALAEKYKVPGYPTVLFLTADGKEVGKSGYIGADVKTWLSQAQAIVDKAKG